MKIRPLYREAETFYLALAKATELSKEDSSWMYVRERLDEVTTMYEDLIDSVKTSGMKLPSSLTRQVSELSIIEDPHEMIDKLSIFEGNLLKFLFIYKAIKSYASKTRIVSALLVILVSGYFMLTIALNPLQALLASLGVGLGMAGLLSYTTWLSPVASLGGSLLLIPLLNSNIYIIISWIMTIIASVIASFIPLLVDLKSMRLIA